MFSWLSDLTIFSRSGGDGTAREQNTHRVHQTARRAEHEKTGDHLEHNKKVAIYSEQVLWRSPRWPTLDFKLRENDPKFSYKYFVRMFTLDKFQSYD